MNKLELAGAGHSECVVGQPEVEQLGFRASRS